MNALARVVHDMVAHGLPADTAGLSPAEQKAVENVDSLLRLSPQELSALMARQAAPEEWLTPPPIPKAART